MSSELRANRGPLLKVVFDTNIYISAFLKSGLSREIFNLAVAKKIILFCSPEILAELQEKLRRKLKVSESDIELFIRTISRISSIVIPTQKLSIIKADPKDNIVLECAQEAEANLIVTIDKHLLRFRQYQNIGIIHPRAIRWTLPEFFE